MSVRAGARLLSCWGERLCHTWREAKEESFASPRGVFERLLPSASAKLLQICTRVRFTQTHVPGCFTISTSSYSLTRRTNVNGDVWGADLSVIHFRG